MTGPELPRPPDRSPRDPRDPSGFTDAERARARGILSRWLQAGGIVFLAVVALGLLPTVLGAVSPALGRAAAAGAWVVAPLLVVGLLVFAALRLRR